jgi:hypothetical protein
VYSVVVCVAAALCVRVSVCMLLFDFRERALHALLCRCVAVSLCRSLGVFVQATALHWTVAAAVSGSSRTAAVAMRGSLSSGFGAVS